MKILHYTQYVFGIGHLFRSMAIDRALAPLTVDLVTGGADVPIPMPENVRHHAMPALRMDEHYGEMLAVDQERGLEETWKEREAMLLDLFRTLEPDVLLIEMFPFGRRLFSRELLPLLAANRERRRPAATLCSVRDILVEKKDQAKFEKRVLGWLNPWFDGVLVHSDPDLIRLDRTFSRVADIAGPNAPAEERERLTERGRAHPDAVIREFTPRFPDHVMACDLSVSRGGYNTTMNLLACRAKGLMHPYGHDREQRMRLEALSALGHVGLLEDADLAPARLAGIMERALLDEHRPAAPVRLQGDRESAEIIRRLAAGDRP